MESLPDVNAKKNREKARLLLLLLFVIVIAVFCFHKWNQTAIVKEGVKKTANAKVTDLCMQLGSLVNEVVVNKKIYDANDDILFEINEDYSVIREKVIALTSNPDMSRTELSQLMQEVIQETIEFTKKMDKFNSIKVLELKKELLQKVEEVSKLNRKLGQSKNEFKKSKAIVDSLNNVVFTQKVKIQNQEKKNQNQKLTIRNLEKELSEQKDVFIEKGISIDDLSINDLRNNPRVQKLIQEAKQAGVSNSTIEAELQKIISDLKVSKEKNIAYRDTISLLKEQIASGELDITQTDALIQKIKTLEERIRELEDQLGEAHNKTSDFQVFFFDDRFETQRVVLDSSPERVRKFFTKKRDAFVEFSLRNEAFKNKDTKQVKLTLKKGNTIINEISETVSKKSKIKRKRLTLPHDWFKYSKNTSDVFYIELTDDENNSLLTTPYKIKLN